MPSTPAITVKIERWKLYQHFPAVVEAGIAAKKHIMIPKFLLRVASSMFPGGNYTKRHVFFLPLPLLVILRISVSHFRSLYLSNIFTLFIAYTQGAIGSRIILNNFAGRERPLRKKVEKQQMKTAPETVEKVKQTTICQATSCIISAATWNSSWWRWVFFLSL